MTNLTPHLTATDLLQILYLKIDTSLMKTLKKKLLGSNLTTHLLYALLFTALRYSLTLLEYIDFHAHTYICFYRHLCSFYFLEKKLDIH